MRHNLGFYAAATIRILRVRGININHKILGPILIDCVSNQLTVDDAIRLYTRKVC